MTPSVCNSAATAAVLFALWFAPPAAADVGQNSYLAYSGTATALGSNRFVYGEEHFVRYQDGLIAERVVLYECANGAPFARKNLRYATPLAPDFELLDAARGLHEGMRSTGGGREVFYRDGPKEREKTAPAPTAAGMVADAGFDEFVRARWSELLGGGRQRLDFLVPSRLESLDFQLRHVQSTVVEGAPAEMFRLSLSGVLGWLLPSIDVYYSKKDQVLLRYDGLSNLQDPSGGNYKVHILFAPSQRRPSDQQALQKARAAPLRACR